MYVDEVIYIYVTPGVPAPRRYMTTSSVQLKQAMVLLLKISRRGIAYARSVFLLHYIVKLKLKIKLVACTM